MMQIIICKIIPNLMNFIINLFISLDHITLFGSTIDNNHSF